MLPIPDYFWDELEKINNAFRVVKLMDKYGIPKEKEQEVFNESLSYLSDK